MVRVVDVIPSDILVDAVRQVSLLSDEAIKPYENADIAIKTFDLSTIRPTTLYVLRKNLETQRRLATVLAAQGHDPLGLDGQLLLDTGDERIGLIPPIVEHDPVYGDCLIDGAHRTYVGLECGRTSIRAIHVHGAHPDYPMYAHANDWHEIIEYDDVPNDPALKKRYRTDNPQNLYRNISGLNGSAMR